MRKICPLIIDLEIKLQNENERHNIRLKNIRLNCAWTDTKNYDVEFPNIKTSQKSKLAIKSQIYIKFKDNYLSVFPCFLSY